MNDANEWVDDRWMCRRKMQETRRRKEETEEEEELGKNGLAKRRDHGKQGLGAHAFARSPRRSPRSISRKATVVLYPPGLFGRHETVHHLDPDPLPRLSSEREKKKEKPT